MRLVAFFLLLALSGSQCSKKGRMCCAPEPIDRGPNGTWRQIETLDAHVPGGIVLVPNSDIYLLNLHSDWTYSFIDNGQLADTGRYKEVLDTVFMPGRDTSAFQFGNGGPEIYRFSANQDSLFLLVPVEIATQVYVKYN